MGINVHSCWKVSVLEAHACGHSKCLIIGVRSLCKVPLDKTQPQLNRWNLEGSCWVPTGLVWKEDGKGWHVFVGVLICDGSHHSIMHRLIDVSETGFPTSGVHLSSDVHLPCFFKKGPPPLLARSRGFGAFGFAPTVDVPRTLARVGSGRRGCAALGRLVRRAQRQRQHRSGFGRSISLRRAQWLEPPSHCRHP